MHAPVINDLDSIQTTIEISQIHVLIIMANDIVLVTCIMDVAQEQKMGVAISRRWNLFPQYNESNIRPHHCSDSQGVAGMAQVDDGRDCGHLLFLMVCQFSNKLNTETDRHSTVSSSIITPGRTKYKEELHVSLVVSVLPFSLFNFGLAFGPILGSPLSERYGRQIVFLVCMPTLLIFVMACGFSNDVASLLTTRALGGLAGSAGITIASATIADLFEPGPNRAAGLFAYYSAPFLGAVVGYALHYAFLELC